MSQMPLAPLLNARNQLELPLPCTPENEKYRVMTPRLRIYAVTALLSFTGLSTPVTVAQNATPSTPAAPAPAPGSVQEEIRALRLAVDQQSKQIQALTDQVARLTLRLELGNATTATPGPGAGTPIAPPHSAGTGAAAIPARVVPPEPAPNVHIVVKGDSLDKIAKLHGTTVVQLQKINRITDPKRLQIGQQIILPPDATPAPKPEPSAESNTEKKEGQ